MIQLLDFLSLGLAIPLGMILAKINYDERNIYNNAPYFPVILWVLAISAAIFFSINYKAAMALTFSWLTILVWSKSSK
jgi:cobalamin synthase